MLALDTAPSRLGDGDALPGRPVGGSRVRLRPRTPADGSMQGWILEFPPEAEAFVKPLDGWIGARVRVGGTRLDFATRADAETFAHRHRRTVEADPRSDATTH